MMISKPTKIFISHSSADKDAATALVDLIEQMGISVDGVYCTSYDGLGVSLRENIYSSMRKQFDDYELFVIFVLSSNYYTRPACLNEMGASWILKLQDTSILLPGFDFKDVCGAIDKNNIAIKIDASDAGGRLNELRETLCRFMGVEVKNDAKTLNRWETKRNEFIKKIKDLPILSPESEINLLRAQNENLKMKLRDLEKLRAPNNSQNGVANKPKQTATAAQVISRFFARPSVWNGKTFIGSFLIGAYGNAYAKPMPDWLCHELNLQQGYPIVVNCTEIEGSRGIEIFADGEQADALADIREITFADLELKAVHFKYKDYEPNINPSWQEAPELDYYIFEVQRVLATYKSPKNSDIPF